MMRALLRHDYKMGMWNTVAMHEIADSLQGKDFAHATTQPLGEPHNIRREAVRDIGEVIDVFIRNHDAFARCRWSQSHERRHAIVSVDEARRRAARDNFAEDARHCGL